MVADHLESKYLAASIGALVCAMTNCVSCFCYRKFARSTSFPFQRLFLNSATVCGLSFSLMILFMVKVFDASEPGHVFCVVLAIIGHILIVSQPLFGLLMSYENFQMAKRTPSEDERGNQSDWKILAAVMTYLVVAIVGNAIYDWKVFDIFSFCIDDDSKINRGVFAVMVGSPITVMLAYTVYFQLKTFIVLKARSNPLLTQTLALCILDATLMAIYACITWCVGVFAHGISESNKFFIFMFVSGTIVLGRNPIMAICSFHINDINENYSRSDEIDCDIVFNGERQRDWESTNEYEPQGDGTVLSAISAPTNDVKRRQNSSPPPEEASSLIFVEAMVHKEPELDGSPIDCSHYKDLTLDTINDGILDNFDEIELYEDYDVLSNFPPERKLSIPFNDPGSI